MTPAVFLDRDGVINRATLKNGRPHPPQSLETLEILPGVADAVARFRAAGMEVVVVTNQPDVARGTQDLAVVEGINRMIAQATGIVHFRVCYHDDADGCDCRKPKPGLLIKAAADMDLDLSSSVMVGDRWRDIDAGKQAGCRTVWIDCGYDEKQPVDFDLRAASLIEAADWILARRPVSA